MKTRVERFLRSKLRSDEVRQVISDLCTNPRFDRLRPRRTDHLEGQRYCTYEYRDLPFPYHNHRLLYVLDEENMVIDLVDVGSHDILDQQR